MTFINITIVIISVKFHQRTDIDKTESVEIFRRLSCKMSDSDSNGNLNNVLKMYQTVEDIKLIDLSSICKYKFRKKFHKRLYCNNTEYDLLSIANIFQNSSSKIAAEIPENCRSLKHLLMYPSLTKVRATPFSTLISMRCGLKTVLQILNRFVLF